MTQTKLSVLLKTNLRKGTLDTSLPVLTRVDWIENPCAFYKKKASGAHFKRKRNSLDLKPHNIVR